MISSIRSHPQWKDARKKVLFNLPFWIAASATALVSVLYNQLFRLSEDWALSQSTQSTLLWTAPVALLVSFLLGHFFSLPAIGSGIPQVIASVELSTEGHPYLRHLLSFRMILVKIFGSCVCVLGGGVSGREGPTLQISTAIFYQLSRFWPKKLPQPALPGIILAGGAAGLASAFNTPLGGVVFAIEELSKSHISLVRTAIFQAVIIAGLMAQLFLGNYLYLGETNFGTFPASALLHTLFIAAIVGVVGSAFAESLYRFSKWRTKKSFLFKVAVTLVCGALLSLTLYFCGPSSVGAGKHVMVELLKNPTAEPSALLPAGRILGSLFTYSAGAVGGIFAPALSSGAALAQYLSWLFDFGDVKLMILVGMVAFLTGITRTPFTSFVLVLEMSNSHEIVLYLMLSSLIANVTARLVNTRSFYEQAATDIIHAHTKAP